MEIKIFNIVDFIGIFATITSTIGFIPQVYKSFKTKSTDSLSIVMIVNAFICSVSWIFYGLYTNATYVFYSNIINLITCFILILQKYYYDKLQKSNKN